MKTLSSGFTLPIYGLGTWQMGGQSDRDPEHDDAGAIASMREAIRCGVSHIDTAENYANGYTETLVGQAIKGYSRRSIFLATKVRASHMAYRDTIRAAKESLQRLGTDYLDLYLLHRHHPTIPLSETLGAFDELVQQGLVRHIGVCNFPVDKLKEAQSLTKQPIVCNQVHYNLRVREAERAGVLQYCQEHDIMLVAWRPIQMGTFSDRANSLIESLMVKYQKSATQIALNWLMSQRNVVVIAKTSRFDHLHENMGAIGWSLTSDDVERLRREYQDQLAISDAVPLNPSPNP